MRKSLIAAASALFLLLPAQANAITGKQIVADAIDGFVRPAYAQLADRTSAMETSMQDLCKAPSDQALAAAHQSFAALVEAWSQVEIVRFGPITENNRIDRMLFWPDRKGTGLRQVQAALADKDETAADAGTLAQKSVAMQGLGALEFVLYGTGSETLSSDTDPYRCRYGEAIAGNVDAIARDVRDAWAAPDGFARTWSEPAADNAQYRNATESVTTLLEVFVNGTELVRDVRVGGFLGQDAKDDKSRQAVFWRSGQTAPSLKGNMEGMRAIYEASHFGDALPADSSWIDDSIRFEFGNAVRAADLPDALPDILADDKKRAKLAYFKVVTSSLSELFGVRLAGALGLTAGFSSLDGD